MHLVMTFIPLGQIVKTKAASFSVSQFEFNDTVLRSISPSPSHDNLHYSYTTRSLALFILLCHVDFKPYTYTNEALAIWMQFW